MADQSLDVICPHCGAEWELDALEAEQEEFHCSACNQSFPLRPSPQTSAEGAATATTGPRMISRRAASRYSDAYIVAGAVVRIGGYVRVVAVVVTVIGLLGGIIAASSSPSPGVLFVGGIVFGVAAGIPLYVLGILISAIGEHIKASLDSAVHTSPFLSDAEKASVMSLC